SNGSLSRSIECPEGHYCPSGTWSKNQYPCPAGFINPHTRMAAPQDCLPCPPGFFCVSPGKGVASGQCAAGYYCLSGASSPTPEDGGTTAGSYCPGRENLSRQAIPCSPGHMCPPGSEWQISCLPGTYQALSGQPEEGPTGGRCSAGSYCPQGTTYMVPCPLGTFSSINGAASVEECQPCLPGHYCTKAGLSSPSGPCDPGFYCTEGSRLQEIPHIHHHFLAIQTWVTSMVTCVLQATIVLEGVQSRGPVLQGGSVHHDQRLDISQDVSAHLAMHAHLAVLSQPSVDLALFSILLDSQLVTPAHQGSGSPKPCPVGSFLPEPGASAPSHCYPCPPGKYCLSPGASQPTGFFCSGGADSPTPRANSSLFCCLAEILEVYMEKTDTALWMHNLSCFSYSTNSGKDARRIEVATAPMAGFYCPLGSAYPQPCEAGSYCNQTGLEVPGGPCAAGYYCPKGSLDPHATSCPTGHYCPLGTPLPLPCPHGTIKTSRGASRMNPSVVAAALASTVQRWASLRSLDPACQKDPRLLPQCQAYLEVFVQQGISVQRAAACPYRVQLAPSEMRLEEKAEMTASHALKARSRIYQARLSVIPVLRASYARSRVPAPPGGAPLGSPALYPAQLAMSVLGRIQTFNLSHALKAPTAPARVSPPQVTAGQGFIAAGALAEQIRLCAQLVSSAPEEHQCPCLVLQAHLALEQGTHTRRTAPCVLLGPTVQGCSAPSLVFPSPLDSVKQATTVLLDQPAPTLLSIRVILEEATSAHLAITAPQVLATHSPAPQALSQSPKGWRELLNAHSALLDWYVCLGGSSSPTPSDGSHGYLCPAGHSCPVGSAIEVPCKPGTYSPAPGAAHCLICPKGTMCSSSAIKEPSICPTGWAMGPTPQPSDNFPRNGPCPLGHYCPAGCLSPIPCPFGSIRKTTGHFCSTEGLADPSGTCAAGFYCPFDFSSTTPYAFICPKGHYCPEGSALALPCPTGTYQPNPGSDNCIPCRPGFYCEEAIVGEPWPCPPHSFCPAGTMVPQLCPNGTYTHPNQGGLQEESECLPCPSGRFCRLLQQSLPTWLLVQWVWNPQFLPRRHQETTSRSSHTQTVQSQRSHAELAHSVDHRLLNLESVLKVNRRCATGQVRLAASRECVSPSLHSCNITCGPHGGTLDVEMGICQCELYVSAEELCNTSCLSRLPKLSAQLLPDGQLLLSLKERNSLVWTRTLMDVLGPDIHAKNFGKIHLVQFDCEGVFGLIPTQRGLIDQFLSGDNK
ncbi:hypothetical protein INR49_031223, partial [Caranx melampygus]